VGARHDRNLSNIGSYHASRAAHSKTYVLNRPEIAAILHNGLDFRHIAIEGPLGAGKSRLAERLAVRLDAASIQDATENPFLTDFYSARPGAAFQAQLFSLLARHRQQAALRQTDLFSQSTICDYLFDKDKIYAYLNLDDNELFIYQRLYDLLVQDVATPDLVIYLQSPSDVLNQRLKERAKRDPKRPLPDARYIQELNEAYNHFFFHYTATPLLVVETSQFDIAWHDDALEDLSRQLRDMGLGTRFYVPRTGA
jgi:deoxyadenosine/deoxycytidine kinase